jgi:GTP-binding protein
LDATEDQLDYPVVYAAAKEGWAINSLDGKKENVDDLLNCIRDHIPHPNVDTKSNTKMLIT